MPDLDFVGISHAPAIDDHPVAAPGLAFGPWPAAQDPFTQRRHSPGLALESSLALSADGYCSGATRAR